MLVSLAASTTLSSKLCQNMHLGKYGKGVFEDIYLFIIFGGVGVVGVEECFLEEKIYEMH